MPNSKGGKGYKKGRKRPNRNREGDFNPQIHHYAKVKKKVGEKNIEVHVQNNETKIVSIPGRLYKKVWINPGDYLVITDNEIEWVINDNKKQLIEAKKILETKNIVIEKKEEEEMNDDLDFDFDGL